MASGRASRRKRAEAPVPVPTESTGLDNRIWVALAVLAALVVAVFVGLLSTRGGDDVSSDGATLAGAAESVALFDGVSQSGVTLGSPDAPVTLVEFADLQCPYCRDFDVEALPPLIQEHVRAGTLRLELRGLAFIGPDSERGLRAVLAAGRQDRLYEMKALLYANQGAENSGWLSDDLVGAAARSIPGVDVERLVADMGSGEVSDQIAEHAAEAGQRGVNSTPTVLVGKTGGELEVVQMSTPSDVAAIEEAIAAASG